MNGKPETYSDYLPESDCNFMWQSMSLKGDYYMMIAMIDTEFEKLCDDCERGDCDDCQREPQINEGYL